MKKLHSSCQEGGVAEDVEDVLRRGDKECLALLDADTVDVGFAPKADDNADLNGRR